METLARLPWSRLIAGAAAAVGLLGPCAQAAPLAAPLPIGSTTLATGSRGPAVAVLQADLWQFGDDPGPVDGIFGAQTRAALVRFQESRHMMASGVLDAGTFAQILAALGLGPAITAPLPIGQSVLALGDRGPAVAVLQGDLWQFGLAPGPADGIFGPQTQAALRAFQRRQQIPVTGRLDAATFASVLVALHLTTAMAPAASSTEKVPPAPPAGTVVTTIPSPSPAAQAPPTAATTTASPPASIPSTRSVVDAAAPVAGPGILAYWAVWGDNSTALADLRAHASDLTWLSPYWYTLHGDGTLGSRESDHAAVLAVAVAAGLKVLPLINQGSGVTALLGTASGRAQAVASIGRLLRANPGYAGVIIDLEALPPSSRADFSAFIAALKAKLPTKTVGVAVMPKASDPGPDYARVFDYAALGRSADLIQLMTYDRHSDGSAPGPVSPNDWASTVAHYAASVIPAHKLYLGVPGYGYNWSGGGDSAASEDASALVDLAASLGLQPTLQASSGERTFTYTDGSGVRHTVWYESTSGIATKRSLASDLGLGGLALWTLGGEQSGFWPAALG